MLTYEQIIEASKKHKYLGLRLPSGYLMAVNSKMVLPAFKKTFKQFNQNKRTKSMYVSFKPLTINEYINKKLPFI